uniref:Uncharacterized protein n=1 Tax=Picea glauca TaxID=3330 RepID=A0A117NIU2_PICGL|nr:hypothetical protein ABT39_MTgene368 [Picea glauca]QHR86498.1 hypothetical protein Q903MT_gene500 [Picea sitchensis]
MNMPRNPQQPLRASFSKACFRRFFLNRLEPPKISLFIQVLMGQPHSMPI